MLVSGKLRTPFVKYWKLLMFGTSYVCIRKLRTSIVNFVFLIPSILFYAGRDKREEAVELYEGMWKCYLRLSIGYNSHGDSSG
jgi:hypothetical protein